MKYRLKALDGRLLRTGNRAERDAIVELTKLGYNVFKRGWPDLMVVKDGEIKLYEVKPTNSHGYKPCQAAICDKLRQLGFSVELLPAPDPDAGKGRDGGV